MHFIPIQLKTHNATLLKIIKIPLIGGLLIIFYGILPLIILDTIAHLTHIEERIYLIIGSLLTLAWNYYLQTKKTNIKLLFLPLWAWVVVTLLLIVLGVEM